jgi:hypothetical protein
MIDPSSTDRRLVVELYGFGVEGTVCPGMELVSQEGDWYSFYERQMEARWQAGRALEVPSAVAGVAPSVSSGPATHSPGSVTSTAAAADAAAKAR